MATKATKNEIEMRVSQVYKLLLVGTSRRDILQYASKNWGEISDRSVDTYIAKARGTLSIDLRDDRKMALAEEICIRKHLYTKAYADKKWQTCLRISDSIAKLLGLFDNLDRAIELVVSHGFEVIDPD